MGKECFAHLRFHRVEYRNHGLTDHYPGWKSNRRNCFTLPQSSMIVVDVNVVALYCSERRAPGVQLVNLV